MFLVCNIFIIHGQLFVILSIDDVIFVQILINA